MIDLRCKKCGKKVAEVEFGIIEWVCQKCKTYNMVKLDKS